MEKILSSSSFNELSFINQGVATQCGCHISYLWPNLLFNTLRGRHNYAILEPYLYMGKFETTPNSWRLVCMNLHFYTCMSVTTQHLSRIKARLLLLLLSAWFIHTLPLCGNLRCLLNCKFCLCKRPYNKSSQPGMHWPVYTSSAKLLLLFSLPKVPSTLLTSQLHYIKERSVLRSPINHQKFFIIIILCKQWYKILIVP